MLRHILELDPEGKGFLVQARPYIKNDGLQSIFKFLEVDIIGIPAGIMVAYESM
jgi:hypothetical protein